MEFSYYLDFAYKLKLYVEEPFAEYDTRFARAREK